MFRLQKWLFIEKLYGGLICCLSAGHVNDKRFMIKLQIVKTMKALPYMVCLAKCKYKSCKILQQLPTCIATVKVTRASTAWVHVS